MGIERLSPNDLPKGKVRMGLSDWIDRIEDLKIWDPIFRKAVEQGMPSNQAEQCYKRVLSLWVYHHLSNLTTSKQYSDSTKFLKYVYTNFGIYPVLFTATRWRVYARFFLSFLNLHRKI